jgi:hypothetical protein
VEVCAVDANGRPIDVWRPVEALTSKEALQNYMDAMTADYGDSNHIARNLIRVRQYVPDTKKREAVQV